MDTSKNHYVELVRTKPNCILHCQKLSYLGDTRARIANISKQFTRVYCELGSGSGGHLIELAKRNPEAAYFGFELRYKRIYRTAEKAEKADLINLFLIQDDARFVTQLFSLGSLPQIYINFPDPWDKRRWHKHRLICHDFVTALRSLLSATGSISYKTDHSAYFEETRDIMLQSGFYLTSESKDLATSPFEANNVPTEFESLFKSKNLPIFYLEAKKSSLSEFASV